MTTAYNKYYQTEHLFGEPYPELITFFTEYSKKGKILDLGCGQGRDSIPLARLGYQVTGVDSSNVGIKQMQHIAEVENLTLTGKVADIYAFENFAEYDIILLDSMFHFAKNDKKKETDFIKRILSKIKNSGLVVFCIQDTSKKMDILNKTIDSVKYINRRIDNTFEYIFIDQAEKHTSKTNYRMVIIEKQKRKE